MLNWLKHFKLPMLQAHASGHACQSEIKAIVEKIKPRRVIPIHTERKELFNKMSKKVILAKVNESIVVK